MFFFSKYLILIVNLLQFKDRSSKSNIIISNAIFVLLHNSFKCLKKSKMKPLQKLEAILIPTCNAFDCLKQTKIFLLIILF